MQHNIVDIIVYEVQHNIVHKVQHNIVDTCYTCLHNACVIFSFVVYKMLLYFFCFFLSSIT